MSELKRILCENSANLAITAIDSHNEINEKNLSYSELNSLIERVNFFFEKHELKPGDDVLILLPNSLEMAVIYLASIEYGLNFIPVSCEANKNDIEQIYEIANPKLCIISKLIYENLKEHIKTSTVNISVDIQFSWLNESALAIEEDRVSKTYISTSGTTGEPKIMVIDNNKLIGSAKAFLSFHGLQNTGLRFWNYLPMSYLGGLFNLLLIPLVSGGSAVITETFNGKTFLHYWQTVERFNINALWLTPSISRGLCLFGQRLKQDVRKKYTKNIQKAFIGTAPISLKDKENFEELFNLQLLENFALSETTFFTSETPENICNRIESSVGEVLPYADIKLEKITDEITEIKVKTPYLFDGYLKKGGELELELDEEGYFSTKDLGYLKDKTIVIQGRNRDIIKKGGYFIQLREIELLVEKNENVQEACAVKIPHDFYGESYNLYVVLKDKEKPFDEWVFDNIIKYKWPENIIVRDEFPKTESGKVKKELLNE